MKEKITLLSILGARPQFIKIAPLIKALDTHNLEHGKPRIEHLLVHTGQHYDYEMSKVFFKELEIPEPDYDLGVGSGNHGYQVGNMLIRLEEVLLKEKPDLALVYGDTNSTLAGALAAAKLHIPVGHIEAGLRSFNRKMPEETNRVLTDHVSSLLFCPTEAAVKNLQKEGLSNIVHNGKLIESNPNPSLFSSHILDPLVLNVGDVIYDSVLFNTNLAEQYSTILYQLGLESKSFYLTTIHRAENTDNKDRLDSIFNALGQIDMPIVLPMHPRTKNTLGARLDKIGPGIRIIDPVSYLDMLMLEKNARVILTDSGGVQKEAYWANVPCITLRDETEWIELVKAGYNRVVGTDTSVILEAVAKAENEAANGFVSNASDLYGDGHSAEKIVAVLDKWHATQ